MRGASSWKVEASTRTKKTPDGPRGVLACLGGGVLGQCLGSSWQCLGASGWAAAKIYPINLALLIRREEVRHAPSRDFRCRERSMFSDWKSSSAQDMSKKVSFFYSCFVFRRACPLARESSFRLDFSSWNSSSPQDMTKKEPFFTSVSFFMRADSLTLERRRFPELFFHIFMIF